MNLPEEIRNKEFSMALRGYNVNEVEDYIEMLLEKYDVLYEENARLADSLARLSAALETANTAKRDAEAAAQRAAEDNANRAKNTTAQSGVYAGTAETSTARNTKHDAEELARMERELAGKRTEYNAMCEEIEKFRNGVFALYAEHIESLGNIRTERKQEHVKPSSRSEKNAAGTADAVFGELSLEAGAHTAPHDDTPLILDIPEEDALHGADEEFEIVQADTAAENDKADTGAADVKASIAGEPEHTGEADTGSVFTTGLHITREPVGAANSQKSFSDVRERLKEAKADPDTGKASDVNKKRKFF